MTFQTRPLTGLDPWPLSLVTGTPKSGKTHVGAAASASPLIDRTFWFTMGEDTPDGFQTIDTGMGPVRAEAVVYDGTYRGLLGAMQEALHIPSTPGKPHLWVLDSGTKLWQLITDMAQEQANQRWARRDANKNRELPEDGVTISMDLWTTAKNRWNGIIDLMRQHQGPSIITARLDQVNAVNSKGDPTGEKIWKIQAEKSLPFEVDAIIELRARNETYLTGVRSSRYNADPKAVTRFPGDFTFDAFWRKLGFADSAHGVRDHVTSTGAKSQARDDLVIARRRELLSELREMAIQHKFQLSYIAQKWTEQYGTPIEQTADIGALELFRDDVRTKLNNRRQGNAA